jgi:hypothetical protein
MGGKLASYDGSAAMKVPGVEKIVVIPACHILFGSRKKGPVQCLESRGAAGENPSLRPPNNATTSRSWWV